LGLLVNAFSVNSAPRPMGANPVVMEVHRR